MSCILTAMESYMNKSDFQGHACVALTNIAHSDDNNKRIIAHAGGIEKILDAMEAFVGDYDLQKKAVWAILTVSAEENCAKRCAKKGAVGAVLAAMLNFSSEGR